MKLFIGGDYNIYVKNCINYQIRTILIQVLKDFYGVLEQEPTLLRYYREDKTSSLTGPQGLGLEEASEKTQQNWVSTDSHCTLVYLVRVGGMITGLYSHWVERTNK